MITDLNVTAEQFKQLLFIQSFEIQWLINVHNGVYGRLWYTGQIYFQSKLDGQEKMRLFVILEDSFAPLST